MLLVLLQSMSLCKTPKIFPQVQVLRHPFANLDFGFRGLRSCSQTAQVPTHYVRAGSVADGQWYVLYWRLRDTVALTLGISAQMRATSTPCPTLPSCFSLQNPSLGLVGVGAGGALYCQTQSSGCATWDKSQAAATQDKMHDPCLSRATVAESFRQFLELRCLSNIAQRAVQQT